MPREKGSGSTNIYYSEDKNRWYVSYYVIDSITNEQKRIRKPFKSEIDAKLFVSHLNNENENYSSNSNYTLNDILKIIIKEKLKNNIVTTRYASTLKDTNKLIDNSLLANKKIQDITNEEIQDFLNSLSKYSNDYIKRISNQLEEAFKYSLLHGYISYNPMLNTIRPKSIKDTVRVRGLTKEEQTKFVDYLIKQDVTNFPYKNLYLILLYMGLRIGEALALQYDDIDLKNNVIHINKIVVKDESSKPTLVTEYENSRKVPINELVRFCFVSQKRRALGNPEKFLFLSSNYTLVETSTVNAILKRTFNKLGFEGISTQSLRYTYRDNCLEEGLLQEEIIKLIGPINFE